ncbi:MAG: DUF4331 domain-containing protein [Chloroflexi bacterium]|nr:MAG: DUF4331 domain-containing protein [Chloroflexota bacterium]
MADHLDSPNLTSPAMDARVDITDIYAFQNPADRHKSILILNVNPLAPIHADEFRHDARYELLIDNDGDARPDVRFSILFSRKKDGHQFATVRRRVRSDGADDAVSGAIPFSSTWSVFSTASHSPESTSSRT